MRKRHEKIMHNKIHKTTTDRHLGKKSALPVTKINKSNEIFHSQELLKRLDRSSPVLAGVWGSGLLRKRTLCHSLTLTADIIILCLTVPIWEMGSDHTHLALCRETPQF